MYSTRTGAFYDDDDIEAQIALAKIALRLYSYAMCIRMGLTGFNTTVCLYTAEGFRRQRRTYARTTATLQFDFDMLLSEEE